MVAATLPIVAGQDVNSKAWIALLEVIKDLDLDVEPHLAIHNRSANTPVLLLGKPPAADANSALGIDVMTVLEREGRTLVPGPSVLEVLHSPAGLERLRRSVRLWDKVRRDDVTDPTYQYNLVEDTTGLSNLVQMTPGHEYVIVDIETSGNIKEDEPEDTELIAVSVLWPPHTTHSEPIIHVWTREALQDKGCLAALAEILCAAPLVAHNAQFDLKWLNNHLKQHIPFRHTAAKLYQTSDTFLLHYCLFPGATGDHGLKALAQKLLGAPEWEREIKKYARNGHYELIPPVLLYSYNSADTYWTEHLHTLLQEWLAEAPEQVQVLYAFLMRASRMLVDWEDTDNGWVVDVDKLQELKRELEPVVYKHLMKLRMTVGDPTPYLSEANGTQRHRYIEQGKALGPQHDFNPRSWLQIQKWLRAQGVPCEGTNEKALLELLERHDVSKRAEKFIHRLLAYRHVDKMLSTYVDGVISRVRNGKAYPRFNLAGTVTGRLASWIHTIPRPTPGELDFRAPYTCEDHEVIVGADYAQLELRIVAELCGDPQLIADLQEDQPDFFSLLLPGSYPHLFRSIEDVWAMKEGDPGRFKGLRNTEKPIVHGMNYGRKAGAIAAQLKMPLSDAQRLANAYLRRYPRLTVWQRGVMARVEGKTIDPRFGTPGLWTAFGRRFQQGVITDDNEWSIKNQALAFEPQSTGSDICLSAAMDLHENRLHMFGARIVNSQHDALYVVGPAAHADEIKLAVEKRMRKAAEKVFTRVPFPVDAKVGRRWSEVS